MLYLVSTPIGNLEDITLRALNILFSVEIILCEDTRKTLNLLRHFQKPGHIIPKLISYYEENEIKRIPEVILNLKKGVNIALVTNSGTPTISDPGFRLVRECWKENIRVVSIPGPSSLTSALACSGLPTDKFLFLGFPPTKKGNRMKLFQNARKCLQYVLASVILFAPPVRLIMLLEDIKEVFGDIDLVVCRELTKIYEEVEKKKVSEFLEKYNQERPKGEYVILFNLSS